MGESKVGWAWVGVRRDKVRTFFGDKQEVDRKKHTYEALSRKALHSKELVNEFTLFTRLPCSLTYFRARQFLTKGVGPSQARHFTCKVLKITLGGNGVIT